MHRPPPFTHGQYVSRPDEPVPAQGRDGEIVQKYMDEIETPATKAYMTCRAVLAAKIDFDATSNDRNDYRSEANRKSEDFFRSEASIGME
jgi:hypothetical protein